MPETLEKHFPTEAFEQERVISKPHETQEQVEPHILSARKLITSYVTDDMVLEYLENVKLANDQIIERHNTSSAAEIQYMDLERELAETSNRRVAPAIDYLIAPDEENKKGKLELEKKLSMLLISETFADPKDQEGLRKYMNQKGLRLALFNEGENIFADPITGERIRSSDETSQI